MSVQLVDLATMFIKEIDGAIAHAVNTLFRILGTGKGRYFSAYRDIRRDDLVDVLYLMLASLVVE